jgi:hypothetical protein
MHFSIHELKIEPRRTVDVVINNGLTCHTYFHAPLTTGDSMK